MSAYQLSNVETKKNMIKVFAENTLRINRIINLKITIFFRHNDTQVWR